MHFRQHRQLVFFSWCLLTSFLAVLGSSQLQSSTMKRVSYFSGPLCAADRATPMFQARSLIDCQRRCTTQKNKRYASHFYSDTQTCEMYNFKPKIFTRSRKKCQLFMNYELPGDNIPSEPGCQSNNKLFVSADNILLNVYINGNETSFNLPLANNWQQVTSFPLPCVIVTVVVRAQNAGGVAGILVWDSSETILSDATWKCVDSTDMKGLPIFCDDSIWTPASEIVTYGGSPWGSGVQNTNGPAPTSSSKWIRTPGNSISNDVYCRFILT